MTRYQALPPTTSASPPDRTSVWRRWQSALFVAAVVAGALWYANCNTATPPVATSDEPSRGGRVIWGALADAQVLNPVLTNDTVSNAVTGLLYPGLLRVNAKTGVVEPNLAESFQFTGDVLTMTLREGLVWSDGTALSGEDFAFTVEAVMRSPSRRRRANFQDILGAVEYAEGQAESIRGIQVAGRTVTVLLARPFCPALSSIGSFGVIPRSVFGKYMDPKDPKRHIDEAPENAAPRVTSGPFVFKEWQRNETLTLARNERYFRGAPLLDEWVMRVIPGTPAIAAAITTAEIDLASPDARDVEALARREHLAPHSYLLPNYTFIGWNQLRGGKEFLQSKSVRQALAYGLNADQIVEKIYAGEGQRVYSPTSPLSAYYDARALNTYSYDPAKARTLLEADGWRRGADGFYVKDGQLLSFTMVTNGESRNRESALQVAIQQYREIGVEVTPQVESAGAVSDRVNRSRDATYGGQGGRDFDAIIYGWASVGADPDYFGTMHSSQIAGNNFVGYKSAAVDQALETGRAKCAVDDRRAAYGAADKQINEDQPYLFLLATKQNLMVNRRVQGVDPGSFSAMGLFWNVETWWVRQ